MRTPSLRIAAAGGLLLAATVTGCGMVGQSHVKFNNDLANANAKLRAAGAQMGHSLGAALQNQPGSKERLLADQQNLHKVLDDVKAEMAAMKKPSDASSQAMYAAYQQFLQGQERMLQNEVAEAIKIAIDESLQPFEKQVRVTPLLQKIQSDEAADLQSLQAAQRKFAATHNIRIQ